MCAPVTGLNVLFCFLCKYIKGQNVLSGLKAFSQRPCTFFQTNCLLKLKLDKKLIHSKGIF